MKRLGTALQMNTSLLATTAATAIAILTPGAVEAGSAWSCGFDHAAHFLERGVTSGRTDVVFPNWIDEVEIRDGRVAAIDKSGKDVFSLFLPENCTEGPRYFFCSRPPSMEALYLDKNSLTVSYSMAGVSFVGLFSAYGRCRIIT